MWYKTGTVAVTNGSTTVTGTGTAFVGAVLAGHGFVAPDGRTYEIAAMVSATQLTLATAYLGGTSAGGAHAIIPTNGALVPFVTRLDTALTGMQSVIDNAGQGKFGAGTDAAPGVRFVADGDTGLTNPAPNQLGFVSGGTRRALLSNTALQVDVPISGTAVTQSATDATAGRLLKVGGFGLGAAAPNSGAGTAWSDITVSQMISGPATAAQPTDKPAAANTAGFTGWHIMSGTGTARWAELVQEAASSAPWRIWARTSNNGVTQDWDLLYTRKSVLGAVAQAAGVPTGAVIERGSNANGEYTRFADGTQICCFSADAGDTKAFGAGTFADPYRSNGITWTFPATFIAAPKGVSGCCTTDTAGLSRLQYLVCRTVTATDASGLRVVRGSADTTDSLTTPTTIQLTAIGRWF